MNDIKSILRDLGYNPITETVSEIRTISAYRNGDNPTSLKIDKSTGRWIDFVTGQSGTFNELVKLSNGSSVNITFNKNNDNTKKTTPKKFDIDYIKLFSDDFYHSYWINRGISLNVIKKFHGGVCKSGKMYNRYVFPIFDFNNNIIGYDGRDLSSGSDLKLRPKWKKIGVKDFWVFPNEQIKNKPIFLTESIGDTLSIIECGYRNVICLFGLKISQSVIKHILKIGPNKIIIALNNDEKQWGFKAANKIKNLLMNYYDENQIIIKEPSLQCKDLNELLLKNRASLVEWIKKGIHE